MPKLRKRGRTKDVSKTYNAVERDANSNKVRIKRTKKLGVRKNDSLQQKVKNALSNLHWEEATTHPTSLEDIASNIAESNPDGDDRLATPHGFVSASYCAAAMTSLYLMHQEDLYCDFSIIILPSLHNGMKDPVTYNVHRLIFSTLSTRIRELPKPMIKIGGKVTCEGIESVIEYVYTGKITDIEKLPIEFVVQVNRAALALGIQLDHYIQKHRNDMVKTSTKVYVGQLHESDKGTVKDKPTLTVSRVTANGKLVLMDKCDAASVPFPKKLKKSFSKQAIEMRRKRANESPQQKAARQEKDRIRKQEFRKRQRELASASHADEFDERDDTSPDFTSNKRQKTNSGNIHNNNEIDILEKDRRKEGQSAQAFESPCTAIHDGSIELIPPNQILASEVDDPMQDAIELPDSSTNDDLILSEEFDNPASESLGMTVNMIQQSLVNGNQKNGMSQIVSDCDSSNPLEKLADSAICPQL